MYEWKILGEWRRKFLTRVRSKRKSRERERESCILILRCYIFPLVVNAKEKLDFFWNGERSVPLSVPWRWLRTMFLRSRDGEDRKYVNSYVDSDTPRSFTGWDSTFEASRREEAHATVRCVFAQCWKTPHNRPLVNHFCESYFNVTMTYKFLLWRRVVNVWHR